MTQVVLNKTPTSITRFSEQAIEWLHEHEYDETAAAINGDDPVARDDAGLVAVVNALGTDAGTGSCRPVIVEIPDDVDWYIGSRAQQEIIVEDHRTWP